jgi:transcriptional regulator with XRE-family HTH domain
VANISSERKKGITSFIMDLMRRRRLLPSRLAAELGVSHVTVSRWISGKDIPSIRSCKLLADYSGMPVLRVLSAMGHITKTNTNDKGDLNWPEFREYAENKYPNVLDEDVIALIEDLIERKIQRNRRKKASVH